MSNDDLRPNVSDTQALWNAKAAYWDARMGEGNAFHRVLIAPTVERLLNVQPDQLILDIACGNGVFSRRLASLGARVVATDFSAEFLRLARDRSTEHGDRIDYRLVDATDEGQVVALGEERFDAVVCNMALMDMLEIDPLIRGIAKLLRPGAPFVFSVTHPAFNSNETRLGIEEEDRDGDLVETRYVRIANYLRQPPGKGAGMPGEPVPHWYFHRPLSELLAACFAAGFVLDGLEEPSFRPEDENPARLSWRSFTEIPPVLVARLRRSERRRAE